jgi:Tfp pilus assembly protein PilN
VRPVNLLPSRYRPARASGDRPGVGYAALGVLAVLLVMVLLYVVTNNGINDAKSKTADAQAQQAAAQAKIGQLQGYGDFATVKAARQAAVQGVALSRFDYERLMREMALVLPHNTYLTQFAASPAGGTSTTTTTPAAPTTATGPSVALSGCAPSHPAVATAIVRLRKLHEVQDVSLVSSTKAAGATATAGSACPVTWSATLSFSPETVPPASATVPARLGGGQ